MLKVIIEHFENDFNEGKKIFVGLELFVMIGEPILKTPNVDHPYNIIKEIRYAGHY